MNREDNQIKDVEGAATLAGVRSDNLSEQMDPTKLPDENPRFPKNGEDKKAILNKENSKELEKSNSDKGNVDQNDQKNSDQPFTVNIYGDQP